MMRKIGVLTSGGDAPGMNAAVMSIARSAAAYGMPLIGIKHGYNGLLRKSTSIKDDLQELYLDTVLDIADQPGTYLRTARCEEFKDPKWREIAVQTLKAMEIDGLVVIGGDGSFQGAMRLCELGIPCIGIPGTIDNDLAYTEMTLGYETAVQVCTEAIRAIRATSRSHDRPHVVECMGRHCGDIALQAACATGSEIVVVPEVPWSVEARSTVVGYTQRGALPVAKDSAFAFEAGNLAVRLLRDGISNQVIGVRQGKVFNMPIVDALKVEKHFRRDLYDLVNNL